MPVKSSYTGSQPTDIDEGFVIDLQNYERRYIFTAFASASLANSIDVYVPAGVTYRVSLYASPSATETDASTLIYDFGTITNSGGASAWISTTTATSPPTIPSGTHPAIFIKGEGTVFVAADWNESFPLGDVTGSRRTWLDPGAAVSSPFPSVAQDDDDVDAPSRIMGIALHYTAASPTATLTNATPAGGITGSSTTATVGATTNHGTSGSNTLFAVASTSSLVAITAAQVKAGQNASGSTSGVISGNASVASTSPSVSLSGLSGGTLYYFAVVQEDANGLSNVLTGSFSTSTATRSTSLTFRDSANAAVVSQSISWFLTSSWGGTVLHSGTTSTNGAGALLLTGLSSAAGGYLLFYKATSDQNLNGMRPVTLV